MSQATDHGTKKNKNSVPEDAKIFDHERQLGEIKLRKMTLSTKPGAFAVNLGRIAPEGASPVLSVTDCTLGRIGKSEEGRRGFGVYTKGPSQFTRLALGVGKSNEYVGKYLERVIQCLVASHHPNRDRWYQESFPELTNGTKVHFAGAPLLNPSSFNSVAFDQSYEHVWDEPARTWGPMISGDDEDYRWYISARVDPDSKIFLYDPKKNKPFGKVNEGSLEVYSKDGVDTSNANVLRAFLDSKVYRQKTWRVRCLLRLTSVEFRCAPITSVTEGEQRYVVYPTFSFATYGPIVLMETDPETTGSMVTDDQREDAAFAAVFGGLVAPSRKRKSRKTTTDTQNAPVFNMVKKSKKNADAEVIEGTDESDGGATDGEDD